jgi:hypothetical protein
MLVRPTRRIVTTRSGDDGLLGLLGVVFRVRVGDDAGKKERGCVGERSKPRTTHPEKSWGLVYKEGALTFL